MKKTFKLEDLDCANCAAKMQNAIQKLDGVKSVNISFLTQRTTTALTACFPPRESLSKKSSLIALSQVKNIILTL